ncbi:alanine--tRNA ligase [Salicibibacter halophilus]|uniref:Alanine--tRNA ligase n=1 Tax=Salicibibacter halophilus TaxID=2502791 RepID=A0A514LLY0_9BACI|nr:alanine--tRNA ligase [Salicibibacter halophilus]QDI92848.1 alanine--tRNA ligase [Salicibibacter halophilus]
MKRLTSADVRQLFLDFFKEKGHDIEPSASLVPHEDPSLLWINSGVATLKKYFDGRIVPENPRIVNAQKAIRTNDIENVGKTARHHTFFEMLGNFSIGDYFKKEAIEYAWEFLTDERWVGFDPERLSATVHPEDDEAYRYWKETIGLPEERIIRLEENFWDIGEGPSGPNAEIFYDRGPAYGHDPADSELYPGGENERYLEIWNLVFSQFNHNPDGTYTPLPNQNIDTGLGLERLVSVIQDTKTNYETDLFLPIIKETEALTDASYGEKETYDTAFKVIADHIRTVSFTIADGALPSNEGRGYVQRRLLRRAVRYAQSLDIHEPFMYRLVPVVATIMEPHYPNVKEKDAFIQKVVRNEEERFHETLSDGLAILNDLIAASKQKDETQISGDDVFRLYDTYGFPVDLTEEYVTDAGLNVDLEGFERAMHAQRERARAARKEGDSMQSQNEALRSLHETSTFVGYEQHEIETEVQAIVQNDARAETANPEEEAFVLLKETPFYAESGGQVADQGLLFSDGTWAEVTDVQQAPNGQPLHKIKVTEGTLTTSKPITASINGKDRAAIQKNHTATHLLHQALKDVLGDHVNQAGSYVGPDRLRFDFSHFGQVSSEELQDIEAIVNAKVAEAANLAIEETTLEDAKAKGAMALFGEKYGSNVRVVHIGDYSIELCGGTHVANSAEVGIVKLISETGIGAGIRRIEAVSGRAAYHYIEEKLQLLDQIQEQLKAKSAEDVPQRVEQLQQDVREKEKENESIAAKLGNMEAMQLLDDVHDINGIPVLAGQLDNSDMDTLRTTADRLKQKLPTGIIVLGTARDGKVNIVATVSKDLVTDGYKAGDIVKKVAAICDGGGGGRPDMAQAGGKSPEKLPEAIAAVDEIVASIS